MTGYKQVLDSIYKYAEYTGRAAYDTFAGLKELASELNMLIDAFEEDVLNGEE